MVVRSICLWMRPSLIASKYYRPRWGVSANTALDLKRYRDGRKQKKASAESSAGRECLEQAFSLVSSPFCVARFVSAVSERWRLASCSHLSEELDVVRSAEPGALAAARSADAVHGTSSQAAHQTAVMRLMDAHSAWAAPFPYAALLARANWGGARPVSPNGFRTAGSNSSGHYSTADSRSETGSTHCFWTYCFWT